MLTGPGLGDHPGLAHPAGEQGLTQHIVDLVRSGVVQVFPFQINMCFVFIRKTLRKI